MRRVAAHSNILETIGNTPLVKLNNITNKFDATVFVKLESFNPGHSAKDRIALHMIEKAEKEGRLKPGSTIIEATSGNTGFSLAMVSALKGYKCLLAVSSKISNEKLNLLKIMGAEVVICPKEAKPEDPNSHYSVAKTLAQTRPNAFYLDQNYSLDNSEAHYFSTGPEIWQQTDGKITHLIGSTGTGGTLSGSAKFLKEQNPDIKIIGVDAYGSVLKKYHETGIFDKTESYSYTIEGTGKSIIPANVNFDLIDKYEKVADAASALRARELAQKDGILVGHSSGGVVQCLFQLQQEFTADDTVVLILCDHGSKYMGKIFNDKWMKDQGFLQENQEYPVRLSPNMVKA